MKKAWNIISWVLVGAAVVLAVLMGGVRLIGLRPYVVLSGSMEPAYPTGSLIYVRRVDAAALQPGDVITFLRSQDVVATHRIVAVEGEGEDLQFRTKGDANASPDGTPVHYKNVLGTPVLTIPYLGYLAAYISRPPGLYVGAAALGMVILLLLAPDLLRAADRADRAAAEKKNRKP